MFECVCVCVSMCVCVCVCVYACMHACINVFIFVAGLLASYHEKGSIILFEWLLSKDKKCSIQITLFKLLCTSLLDGRRNNTEGVRMLKDINVNDFILKRFIATPYASLRAAFHVKQLAS